MAHPLSLADELINQDGFEWSITCYCPLAPAAVLARVSGHPALSPMQLAPLPQDARRATLHNRAHATTCLITAMAPGCWTWPDAPPDLYGLALDGLWSLALSTDWRAGYLPEAAAPMSLVRALAQRTEALIAVDTGPGPGRLVRLVPGFAARTLGLDTAPGTVLDDPAQIAPFDAITTPMHTPASVSTEARHRQAAAALMALLNDPGTQSALGPDASPA